MPTYLSADWLEAAAAAVGADERLQATRPEVPFVLEQVVTGTGGSDGSETDVAWHVAFGPSGVEWRAGRAAQPDVTFTCDAETARAVHRGELSAQGAFMAGQLRIGGDTRVLLANQALLASLHDVLAGLREAT